MPLIPKNKLSGERSKVMSKNPPSPDELERFKRTIQALAQNAQVQIGLYPEFLTPAEELVEDFEISYWDMTDSNFVDQLAPEQLESVRKLDLLTELIPPVNPDGTDPWLNEALATSPDWEQVRQEAARFLNLMGWPNVSPPPTPGRLVLIDHEE